MNIDELVEYLVEHCKNNCLNKIYICGNGGSGKTTLSKKTADYASKYGDVNIISTDDFMVNTDLRKNAVISWHEDNILHSYRYTSSNVESYFLKNVYELIYNIDHDVDCFYFPRRYKEKNNVRQLHSNYFLTVIEGVGTAFLERGKSLSIFLKCNEENETNRRKTRTEQLNRDSIELFDDERSSQFRVNVLSHEDEFDFVIENDDSFNYEIIRK